MSVSILTPRICFIYNVENTNKFKKLYAENEELSYYRIVSHRNITDLAVIHLEISSREPYDVARNLMEKLGRQFYILYN